MGGPTIKPLLMVLTFVLASCGGLGKIVETSAPTNAGSGATASVSPPPSPSGNADTMRKAAAAAYVYAAKVTNAARAKLNKQYPDSFTLKQVHTYNAAASKIESAFIAALKRIVLPPDATADMHTFLVRETALQAIEIEQSTTRTIADANDAGPSVVRAFRDALAAANQLRSDLNLPPVGS